MNIDSLKLFVEVLQKRSFSDVARQHGVAPSSISRSISGLERQLGVRLLQRSTRKLVPTEAGQLYFERIAPLIMELELASTSAADLGQQPRGHLRVSAGITYGQVCLAPLLGELAERIPHLHVELVLTDAFLDLIEERIDVAIRVGTLKSSSHVARRLASMTMYICASPDYLKRHGEPRRPEDLLEHECLLFQRAGYDLNWTFKDRQGRLSEIEIKGKYLINNSHSIRTCCVNGMGITLLPDWLINGELQSGQLVALFPDYQVTATEFGDAIWLIHPSQNYVPSKTRMFMDFMLEKFQANE